MPDDRSATSLESGFPETAPHFTVILVNQIIIQFTASQKAFF